MPLNTQFLIEMDCKGWELNFSVVTRPPAKSQDREMADDPLP
jgi:hypothetical protein